MIKWQRVHIVLSLATALNTTVCLGIVDAASILIHVDTSALSGTAAELVFDLHNGDSAADNTATISNFTTDGMLVGSTPDSFAVGEFVNAHEDLVVANFFSFTIGISENFAGGTPDRFNFFILDGTGTKSLVTTDLPGDALFEADIVGPPQGISLSLSGSAVPNSPAVTVSATAVPEPATVLLLGASLAGLAWMRGRPLRRKD